MLTLTINGHQVQAQEGMTILQAAEAHGVHIPKLCAHADLTPTGNCGVCIVELGNGKTVRACVTPVENNMTVVTNNEVLRKTRKSVVELILSNHPNNCLQCIKNGKCELQALAEQLNITTLPYYHQLRPIVTKDTSSPSITLSPSYCIQCGRCVEVCQVIQNVHALENSQRGYETFVGPTLGRKLDDSECVKCGQCSAHCPVGAIYETDDSEKVWEAINDPEKVCVVQEAPAVRVALGEEFGMPVGTNVRGKMYAALRRMGFKYVFDTNFGADLTIIEEASEFVHIFKNNPEELPLITTCCPSWVDYLEKFFYDMIPHFSSAKSPHQMVGSILKTYWAQKMNIPVEKIFLVSVMPCTAKKFEIDRMESMYASGHKDVDATITTRELARMLKVAGIDLNELADEEPDSPMGEYSGAGTIFGASGGVMEAALRTAYYYVTGEELADPTIPFVRGMNGVKVGELTIAGKTIRIAVASGLANVEQVLREVWEAKKAGKETPYHFIEVMACLGGCVGGGGQPWGTTMEKRQQRAMGLYNEDKELTIRCSHNNPYIKKLYAEFLEAPLSDKAHHLLHTGYIARKGFLNKLSGEFKG